MALDAYEELGKLQNLLEEKEALLRQQEEMLNRLRDKMAELQRKNEELATVREQLQQEITRASSFSSITNQIALTQSLTNVLDFILGQIPLFLAVEKSSIMLREEETDELRIVAARGTDGETRPVAGLKVGEGIAGLVAAQGRRVVVPDTARDERFFWTGEGPRPSHFLVSLPVFVNGQVIGILNVERSPHLPPPTEEQIARLEDFATQIAITIQNVRLYENLSRRVEELSVLYEVGRELSSSLELDKLLRKIVDSATRVLDCEICSLMLFDEKKETLRIRYAKGLSPKLMRTVKVRPGEESVSGWVAEKGKPLLVEDVETHPLFRRKNRAKYSTKSLLSVPLLIRSEVVGVLNVNNKRNDEAFTAEDQEVLMMLASQAAVAIENARLYEDLERLAITDGLTKLYVPRHFHEELDKELRRATRYQRDLSLLMIDIDHFKNINDTYGHPQGDVVLQELAGLLRRYGRQDDIIARYGGEEFVVALVETNEQGAALAAERIRRAVENHEFELGEQRVPITVSVGVAHFPGDASTKKDLIAHADQALYAAKRAGRNRVCLFSRDVAPEESASAPGATA